MKKYLSIAACLVALALCTLGCGAKYKGKVLVVLSGADHLTLKDGSTHPTGYFQSELMIPVTALKAAGFEVVFANPTGKEPVADATSEDPSFYKSQEEFQAIIKHFKSLTGLKHPRMLSSLTDDDLKKFSAIFVPGGHAPMEDLYKDPDVGRILRYFNRAKKPTALICHGPVALLAAAQGDDWPYKGYRLTVFSDVEENTAIAQGAFKGGLVFFPEDALAKAGATIVNNQTPWQENVIVDRELITGQNPMSTHKFADELVKMLKGEK